MPVIWIFFLYVESAWTRCCGRSPSRFSCFCIASNVSHWNPSKLDLTKWRHSPVVLLCFWLLSSIKNSRAPAEFFKRKNKNGVIRKQQPWGDEILSCGLRIMVQTCHMDTRYKDCWILVVTLRPFPFQSWGGFFFLVSVGKVIKKLQMWATHAHVLPLF